MLGTHTFYYSVIEGNADAYDPVMRIKTADSHVEIAIKECEITEELIEQNGTIELLAYTDSEYDMYQLKVTTLPLMNLDAAEEIADTNVSMHMTLSVFIRYVKERLHAADAYYEFLEGRRQPENQ